MICTLEKFREMFVSSLSSLYDEKESLAIFYAYFSEKLSIPKYEISLNPQRILTEDESACVFQDLERLSHCEPLQYVLGNAEFYGLNFSVSDKVLIPRPETEELVEKVIQHCHDASKEYRILDLCTGSGAIAVALAHQLPNARITATDYDDAILQIAAENARRNRVKITFLCHDVLKDNATLLGGPYDVVVSNPPYIPLSMRSHLHRNVVDYEPEKALFVPDDDPLLFYRKIAQLSQPILTADGKIFFETHENFHGDLALLLESLNFHQIEKINDINNKPRFITCKKTK